MVFTNTKKITSFTKIIVKVENHKTYWSNDQPMGYVC